MLKHFSKIFFLLIFLTNSCEIFTGANGIFGEIEESSFILVTSPNSEPVVKTSSKSVDISGTCSLDILNLSTTKGEFLDLDCSDGTWALKTYTLSEGDNVFLFTGSNLKQKLSSIKITFDYISSPSLLISAPNSGLDFTTGIVEQTISGTCSSNSVSIETSLGEFIDSDCSDGTWALLPFSLNIGVNTFNLVVKNSLDIASSKNINITYNPPPTVEILTPNLGVDFTTGTLIQTISGTCSSNSISIETSLGEFLDDDCSDGTWALQAFTLNSGNNTFLIKVKNNIELENSDTISIFLDDLAPNQANVFVNSPTTNKRPIWSWTSGGGGNGIYRYKLDDCDLENGASITSSLSFQTEEDLELGEHTFYVQERDDFFNWSLSSSKTVTIEVLTPLYSWGQNFYGQLGNSVSLYYSSPVISSTEGDTLDIKSGTNFSIALDSLGKVWAWGYNNYGQLGIGNTVSKNSPFKLTNISAVSKICVGENQSFAIKTDATLWAWGYNNYGQLGDGTTTQRNSPVKISVIDVENVSSGLSHTLALKNDGTVWAWGYNNYGQLGDGTTTQRKTPVQVAVDINSNSFNNVIFIVAGFYHSMAIKADGTVWAWGYNNYGQLGLGNTTNVSKPKQLETLSNVSFLSAGYYHSLAVTNSGQVYAWGRNNYYQVGNNSLTTRTSPILLATLSNIIKVSAGGYYSLALKDDGQVYAWGINNKGQLGDETILTSKIPKLVNSLDNIETLDAGYEHASATDTENTVLSWGASNLGQTGNNLSIYQDSPNLVSNFIDKNVFDLSSSGEHSLSILSDDTVWAWGRNNYGQLGNNSIIDASTAVQINLSELAKVRASLTHSLAVKNDGTVWAWGRNNYYQLGDGTTTQRNFPVQITLDINLASFNNVVDISSGFNYHSLAIKADATVWAWGYNNYGQLGDGTTTNRSRPKPILTDANSNVFDNVILVSSSTSHSLALKNDGSVWAWGRNNYSQLGDNTSTTRKQPVKVDLLSNIVAISSGSYHNLALKDDGSVWAWGYNNYGQLGDNTTTIRRQAIQINLLTNIVAISAGSYHNLALKDDGSIWVWGYNNYGQLGNGGFLISKIPVKIEDFGCVKILSAGTSHSVIYRYCN